MAILNTDGTQYAFSKIKNELNQLKSDLVAKANMLSYEEIMASTPPLDLHEAIPKASALKETYDTFNAKQFDIVPANNVYITNICSIQDIVFVIGKITTFPIGVGHTFLTLLHGYKLATELYAPISCYGSIDAEIYGEANSDTIKINISDIHGEGKFNFFFRVKK